MSRNVEQLVADHVESRYEAWMHALSTVNHWLTIVCRDALGAKADPMRLMCAGGRIKETDRIVDKLRRKGAGNLTHPADVERVVTDIVATKVLCKSTRDQAALDRALALQSADGIEQVERMSYATRGADTEEEPGPKPSGYRAIHYLFEVRVPAGDPVTVELQIKTRLQDAWGELTHEDLYKPGRALEPSPFHTSVARAMANLLAEVDALADDLAADVEATLSEGSTTAAPMAARGADKASEDGEEDGTTRTVTVRASGPRYALAVDSRGNDGIILARDVRVLAGESGLVNVDDYISVGQTLSVIPRVGEKGQFFEPVELPGDVE